MNAKQSIPTKKGSTKAAAILFAERARLDPRQPSLSANPSPAKRFDAEWSREKQITAQFGLSHTILYNLRREGKIRTVSLRGVGKEYGARLFNVDSIREYLANQEALEVTQ